MGHSVVGLIGAFDRLEVLAQAWGFAAPTRLEHHLGLLPLPDEHLDQLCDGDFTPPARAAPMFMPAGLVRRLSAASAKSPLAYILTNYSGGHGDQAAALFSNGRLEWCIGSLFAEKPSGKAAGRDQQPINHALRALGVTVGPNTADEFVEVGLHRIRDTEFYLPPGFFDA